MFKRMLLCSDGSDRGRRALRRGAELAVFFGAQVHVLSIIPNNRADSAIAAAAFGYACLADEVGTHRRLLDASIEWLGKHGVTAHGYLASGDTPNQIASYANRLAIDLIVLGNYPQTSGGSWWSGPKRPSLSERVGCCILVAVDAVDDPSLPQSS
jgi:nucleotide-binding universal stress UspA family protein